MAVSDKTMFEIYRGGSFDRRFHYIFYTDLEEHEREDAIAKAAAGQSVFSGFVSDEQKAAARQEIERLVDELNDRDEDEDDDEHGESTELQREIDRRLRPFLVA